MTAPAPDAGTAVLERAEVEVAPDTPWTCVLANDPVNLIDYVVMTLMRVLKCPKDKAEQLTMLAHVEGRAVVFSGELAAAEIVANKLMAASLWATLEKA